MHLNDLVIICTPRAIHLYIYSSFASTGEQAETRFFQPSLSFAASFICLPGSKSNTQLSLFYSDFTIGENSVSLRRTSPDGEANYPGNLDVEVTYTFDDNACLRIDYKAKTDADTVVNLTNHSYFNLAGEGSGSVYDQTLKLDCPAMIPTDAGLIPTGEIRPITKGDVFDFSEAKPIGQDIDKDDERLVIAAGYDHTVLLPEHDGLYTFAQAKSEKTGIIMDVATTMPGAQFYSANFLEGKPGKQGHIYNRRDAFCIETQYVPNAVNCDKFASPVLKAGQETHTVTTYTFSK